MAVRHSVDSRVFVRASRPIVRRRQIVLGLAGLTAIALVAAVGSGTTAAWWAVAAMAALGLVYFALLHRARRIAIEREFRSVFGVPARSDFWSAGSDGATGSATAPALDGSVASGPIITGPIATGSAALGPGGRAIALARFCLACAAGWALSPVVFALTLLFRETPRDTTGQRWLANLQAAQERLRDESLRTLAVSAATTASVTAAGTIAAFGGATAAHAATITASAPLPASLGLPTASPVRSTYRVVQGDSLWTIADLYGTTVAELTSLNRIPDPNLIYPGEVIAVPGPPRSTRPHTNTRTSGGTYTVQQGDSLWSIAARFGTTVSVLAATNNIADPNLILPGQVLVVRGGTDRTTGTFTGRQVSPPAPTRARTRVRNTPAVTRTRPIVRRAPSRPAPAHQNAPAPLSAAQTAAQVARAQVAKPYQWAGAGPSSFDCSGLVMYAWAHAGVQLPHYSVSQYKDTSRISESQLRPGDLVFYDTGDGAQPGHVVIYIGNGEIVTADSPGTRVRVESLTWDGTPMGFGRVR